MLLSTLNKELKKLIRKSIFNFAMENLKKDYWNEV